MTTIPETSSPASRVDAYLRAQPVQAERVHWALRDPAEVAGDDQAAAVLLAADFDRRKAGKRDITVVIVPDGHTPIEEWDAWLLVDGPARMRLSQALAWLAANGYQEQP